MLPTAALDYHLPEELIATAPVSPRDSARLMVLRRSDPAFLEHRHVRDLPELLTPGDLMVVNKTHVLPARFRCVRADTGGAGEGLFVSEFSGVPQPGTMHDEASSAGMPMPRLAWHVLLKLRRAKPGTTINLTSTDGVRSGAWLRLIDRATTYITSGTGADGWLAAVEHDRAWPDDTTTMAVLERIGLPPLPPYILASRRRHEQAVEDLRDREMYQTVFATPDEQESHGRGSVAAPTAGLHLTPELLAKLAARGIARSEVVLHVGMGTFKPVETEFVEQHPMHSEWCTVPPEAARKLAMVLSHRAPAGTPGITSTDPTPRVIAVGTTTARTLESFVSPDEMRDLPGKNTRILITPGHRFRHVGALMTNFHLPRSTLLAMVGAFLDDDDRVRGQGLSRLLDAYRTAIEQGYRFYSFGDAMLILP